MPIPVRDGLTYLRFTQTFLADKSFLAHNILMCNFKTFPTGEETFFQSETFSVDRQ